ncbi:PREDICTED: uncharacterized protein LOC109190269 [Ipomoea nil]|uniref:uncharacterized protein LOC109190269 n=1 Tax=Ipomoea nil TaxID=35883 RepID=UPI000900CBC8|nr:PREDICTED: uncharacterized protein LOC109190269 [Ipomoea nil]
MDLSTSKFLEAQMEERVGGKHGNPFLDTFPAAHQRRSSVTKRSMEGPSTPGRPIFSFSVGNFSRKSVPSKWDDAEKWVVNGSSCHDSPAHNPGLKPPKSLKSSNYCNEAALAEMSGVEDAKLSMASKDKFTKEGSFFGNVSEKAMNCETPEVKQRDIGTEMTPVGSSPASRCHTPIKLPSPRGHNTPADRSGPLPPSTPSSASTVDIMQLQECHLAKLKLGTMPSNWSTREEEEEDVSKSLRHFEASNECPRSVSKPPRAYSSWEEEVAKCCLRYQREEAQIQAWVNLQSAKAEAQSKKLEVKIQRMRSKKEEKLMKKMAIAHRKAEELRAAAQLQHCEQMQKVSGRAKKTTVNRHNNINVSPRPPSCTCFPCNTHHV